MLIHSFRHKGFWRGVDFVDPSVNQVSQHILGSAFPLSAAPGSRRFAIASPSPLTVLSSYAVLINDYPLLVIQRSSRDQLLIAPVSTEGGGDSGDEGADRQREGDRDRKGRRRLPRLVDGHFGLRDHFIDTPLGASRGGAGAWRHGSYEPLAIFRREVGREIMGKNLSRFGIGVIFRRPVHQCRRRDGAGRSLGAEQTVRVIGDGIGSWAGRVGVLRADADQA